MEGLWRSEVPAKPGLAVNVDFDTQGNVHSITALPECHLRAEDGAPATASHGGSTLSQGWGVISGNPAQFVAAILLMLSWCFLTALSIHQPSFGRTDLTVWDILGYLNAGNFPPQISEIASPDPGVFGFLAIVMLAGPFLHVFLNHRRAQLGGLVPLAFMVLTALVISGHVRGFLESPLAEAYGAGTTQARHGIWSAVRVGLGTYVSMSLGMYFGALGVTRFIASGRRTDVNSSQEFAA
jgi:hypothetical protein